MKTSNKLLLGIFLMIIILVTTVQLMVYAKYKRGEYVQFQREQYSPMTSVEIPAVRFVSIKGLGNCVFMGADKPKLEIQKGNTGGLAYRVVNDTLYIVGDPANTRDDLQRGSRNNNLVNVYLPGAVPIRAADCSVRVGGAADSASAPSYNVKLENESYFSIKRGHNKSTVYFNQLTIHSEGSNIELDNHVFINDLDLQLIRSKIEDKEAGIRMLTMDVDSNSTVTLSGKNIKALK